jgi:hypothetical protein
MPYTSVVLSWHDFYLVAGAAAATLVGLLFVGLTLHLRIVVSRPDVGGLARVTLGNFGGVLFVSLFMVIPGSSSGSAGIELLSAGAVTLFIVIRGLRAARRARTLTLDLRMLLLRFGLSSLACFLIMAGGGLLVSGRFQNGLNVIAVSIVTLLVVSLRNSWDLLVSVGSATLEELARASR